MKCKLINDFKRISAIRKPLGDQETLLVVKTSVMAHLVVDSISEIIKETILSSRIIRSNTLFARVIFKSWLRWKALLKKTTHIHFISVGFFRINKIEMSLKAPIIVQFDGQGLSERSVLSISTHRANIDDRPLYFWFILKNPCI